MIQFPSPSSQVLFSLSSLVFKVRALYLSSVVARRGKLQPVFYLLSHYLSFCLPLINKRSEKEGGKPFGSACTLIYRHNA